MATCHPESTPSPGRNFTPVSQSPASPARWSLRRTREPAFSKLQRSFLDGSFVTAKLEPNGFDACWNPEGVNAKQLDPVLLDFSRKRAAMKAKYDGELFLMTLPATLEGKPFITFFQEDRQGNPKGIIRIDLLEWRAT